MTEPLDDLPDDEPLVVLDSSAEVEELSAPSTNAPHPQVVSTTVALQWLIELSQLELGRCLAMQAFLQDLGCSDPAIWAAYRLGTGGPSLATLTTDRRAALLPTGIVHPLHHTLPISRATGITIPTYHPAYPEQPIGIARMSPAQHKYNFVSEPVGLCCMADIAAQQRIVIVDGPVLGLRLAQLGIPGVAIAPTPAVLAPLCDWLRGRDIILVAMRHQRLADMHKALGPLGDGVRTALLQAVFSQSSPAALALLGIDRAAVRPERPAAPITPQILREVHDYARARVASGEAQPVLAALHADIPDLIAAYSVGYLPSEIRAALSQAAKRALVGHRLGGALVIPAYDDQSVVVDLLVLRPAGRTYDTRHVFDDPRGLLAPAVLHAADTLIVTDSLTWLTWLYRKGYRNVLLVRGPAEVAHNAGRIAAAGVRQVELRARHHAEQMAASLQQVGITVVTRPSRAPRGETESAPDAGTPALASDQPAVERPIAPPHQQDAKAASAASPAIPSLLTPDDAVSHASPDRLTLVEEDRASQVAIFGVGPIRYAVELRDDGDLRRKVTVRAHGQAISDRFSLATPAQCQRFADNAARKTQLLPSQIVAHLSSILDLLREREASTAHGPTAVVLAPDRAEAEAMLADPALLARITADLGILGWIGDEQTRTLLYLAAISRLLPTPLWCVSRATTGAMPWQGLGLIAALTPPEDLLVAHRVTNALLAQTDERALRHRLLLIDQAETLRPDAAIALRVLHERGGIGWSTVAGTPGHSGEARGPVAVLAAAAGEIDARCRGCFLTIGVDESPEQTARVLAEQRRRQATGAGPTSATRDRIDARHHACQRLLERLPVVLPFAERVCFPATSLRDRADQARFFALCQASALLHQRQRGREEGAIVADERDFDIAVRLSAGLLGVGGEGLSRGARQLLGRLTEAGLATVTMADLGGLLPDWTRWSLRAALQDLLDFGYLASPASGRGQMRSFQLATATAGTLATSRITLRPIHTMVMATEVGGAPPTTSPTETSDVAAG